MEKQHNRGQDGAGMAVIKLDMPPGSDYIHRVRNATPNAIKEIFNKAYKKINKIKKGAPKSAEYLKTYIDAIGEVYLGHLRYGTHGGNDEEVCHPFYRKNSWITRNLLLAGNFNLTNVDELMKKLIELGQHPRQSTDTITVLEKIGHFLDKEVERKFKKYKELGFINEHITNKIIDDIDLKTVLQESAKHFDGGYAMAGVLGHGDAFVLRDPNGIRPAFYYVSDEVVVVASERPCIQTTFGVSIDEIKEVPPGCAIVVKKNGEYAIEKVLEPRERLSCSFERIYFSRGTDRDIYNERKSLGYNLAPLVLKSINNDLENTVFSFIPNTAETAFYGMMKGIEEYSNLRKVEKFKKGNLSQDQIISLLNEKPRIEKLTVKDVKLRTFITEDSARNEMVSHVYDITYGSIKENIDTIVIIDDSIVRGTTLKQSIISNLARLKPKKIIIVSSAPQIRYPDCYGIDMSKQGEFVAFKALIELLKEGGFENEIKHTYNMCLEENNLPAIEIANRVKILYDKISYEDVSKRVAKIITPVGAKYEVEVIYQTVENLHKSCPDHLGDWYFTGNYPTPGGNKVANRAFINYYEGKNIRAY
jgi:amidophosphoribosyltransferase